MTVTRSTGPVDGDFVFGRILDWHLEAFNPSSTESRKITFTVWNLDVTPAVPVETKILPELPPQGHSTLTISTNCLEHTMAIEEDDGILADSVYVTIYGRVYCHRNIPGAVYRNSDLLTSSCSPRIFWYMAKDVNHFSGSLAPVPPTSALTSFYGTTVHSSGVLDNPPSGYDVLMLSDVGAKFDVSAFTGKIVVTLDSGISPFMFWFTGSKNRGIYWGCEPSYNLHWATPNAPDEAGASCGTFIYPALASAPGFVLRNDLMEAYSTTRGKDDVAIYEVTKEDRTFLWVHFGPHFGGDDPAYTAQRLSELVRYALDLLCGKNPNFPPASPLYSQAFHCD